MSLHQFIWVGKQIQTKITNISLALILSLSGLAGSAPLFLSQKAYGISSPIIINEFSPKSTTEWVELLNTTAVDIDLTTWRLTDLTNPGSSPVESDMLLLSGVLPANSLVSFDVSGLNDTGDSIGLYNVSTLVDRVSYGNIFGGSYPPSAGLTTIPTATQSASFVNGAWLVVAYPTKGEVNNAYHVGTTGSDTTGVGSTALPFATAAKAISAVQSGGTIFLESNINTGSAVIIDKALTFNGQGYALMPTFTKTDNANNSAILVLNSNVTLANLTINGASGTSLHGINTYLSDSVVLTDVTINNSDNAALIVNGSSVTATNLNTSGNGWGAVNVDPGSGVTAPSVFTLSSGNLAESTQIWSDGSHVGGSATVSVNATGFSKYKLAGTSNFYIWTNRTLTNAATITKSGITNLYSTLQAAVTDASAGDTINLSSGSYSDDVVVDKALSILGPNSAINPNTGSRGTEAVITGQISVYSGDTTLKGLKITNPSWSGATIKGIHVYNTGNTISNIVIENNLISNIANAKNKGSYGVMVQGDTNNVNIANNKIENISSAGWAHAIEVTPSSGSLAVPQNTTITGNVISAITNPSQSDAYVFSVDSADISSTVKIYADASQITFTGNFFTGAVRNLDSSHSLNAAGNWWGQVLGPNTGQFSGNVTYSPWCSVSDCSSTYAVSGNNLTNIPVGDPLQVSAGPVATGSSVSLPGVNGVVLQSAPSSGSGTVKVQIPAGTTVTPSGEWNGTLLAPSIITSSSVSVPNPAGFSTIVATVIEVGSNDVTLIFDNPVRILIPGQGLSRVGFVAAGSSTFTEIVSSCVVDSGALVSAGLANECKFNDNGDMVIWTNHFTKFATFTRTLNPASTSGSSSSGTTSTKSSTHSFTPSFFATASSATDEVLGQSTTVAQTSSTNTEKQPSVAKTTTSSKEASGKLFGLLWYWWLVILVLAGAGLYGVYRMADTTETRK